MVTSIKQQPINKQKGGYKKIEPRWQPGESGNPAGRPPNSVTTILKNKSNEDNQVLADVLWELAISGDLPAIRETLDRKEGKVADKLQLTGTMLVATPDQLDLAMRMMLENKASELKLLQDAIPLRVDNEQGEVVEGEVRGNAT